MVMATIGRPSLMASSTANQTIHRTATSSAESDVRTASTETAKIPLLLTEKEMLAEEDGFLWPDKRPKYRTGLALSGGGVRAATVALGVLERLASKGLLHRFDYLSTVSGGGYIGSALSWFWCKRRVEAELALGKTPAEKLHRFRADETGFPFQDRTSPATSVQDAAAGNLAFLRQHGSYLTSGDGIGFAGLMFAVIRTVILSLAVWLPLLVGLFLGTEIIDARLFVLFGGDGNAAMDCKDASGLALLKCHRSYIAPLAFAALITAVVFVGTVLFAFLGGLGSKPTTGRLLITLAFAVGVIYHVYTAWTEYSPLQPLMKTQLLFELFVAAAAVTIAVSYFVDLRNWGYLLRRLFERFSNFALPIALATLFIGLLPLIVAAMHPSSDTVKQLGSFAPIWTCITVLSGVGTALYGYYTNAKSILPGVAGRTLAIAGSLLFISGLLLVSYLVAHQLVHFWGQSALTVSLLLIAVSIAVGIAGSLNSTGLHRFYRDRLMETFMPMADAVEKGDARRSDVADSLSIADVVRSGEERGARPYHLVNTHAILINERDNPKIALRGGDSFVVSPAVVGSTATGWMRSRDYLRLQGPLTLASAMAASGAAANANAGYLGTGATRDRILSAVMSILNIRLGLWVGNPRWLAHSSLHLRAPTYFRPGLTSGILGFGHHSKAKFLELSDGGHFENLGLYELIRRRLDLVVVVDAEQDKEIHLSGLVSSVNRIKEDFKVEFKFPHGKGPERLLGRKTDNAYPRGLDVAKAPFIVAKINYLESERGPAKTGVLIYMKSTIVEGLEFATLGYRAINPDFPHQTTADQFFDPDQFEAYRDLGRNSCTIMANALQLVANFDSPDDLLKRYEAWDPDDAAATLTQKRGGR